MTGRREGGAGPDESFPMDALGALAEDLFGGVLDGSVVFSFDRTGYARHARRFRAEDLAVDLTGRVAAVTGGNSGIGRETARGLAERGATVVLLCRDGARGEAAAEEIRAATGNPRVAVETVDVSDLSSVRAAAGRRALARVDVLVNNAGILPDLYATTLDGIESTLATNLVGPFLLTQLLLPRLAATGRGRVVNVSSGGMYTQRLDVGVLVNGDGKAFDGAVQYARTKRALVVLTELWAERSGDGVAFQAMHPGWADTPGVKGSLPRFHAVTRRILRTPAEGADTVLWLAASERAGTAPGGRFWFDREPAPTHLLPFTREDPAERDRLWEACHRLSGLLPEEPRVTRRGRRGPGGRPGSRRRS